MPKATGPLHHTAMYTISSGCATQTMGIRAHKATCCLVPKYQLSVFREGWARYIVVGGGRCTGYLIE